MLRHRTRPCDPRYRNLDKWTSWSGKHLDNYAKINALADVWIHPRFNISRTRECRTAPSGHLGYAMKLSVVRPALGHDVASVRAILKLPGNALSAAPDMLSSSDQGLSQLIETTLRDFPFLVALVGDRCMGFAYARPHRDGAYRWSTDVALHIDPEASPGIAKRLYRQALDDLASQGYLAAYALVSPAVEEGVVLHDRLGFVRLGSHPWVDLEHDVDRWCLSLGDRHPVGEPISFQALINTRRSRITG